MAITLSRSAGRNGRTVLSTDAAALLMQVSHICSTYFS
jgi:hypothetical protein